VQSEPISRALSELERARQSVKRVSNRQVRDRETRASLSSTAFAWFNTHRKAVQTVSEPSLLQAVDAPYHVILAGADSNTTKVIYLKAMKNAKASLIKLRKQLVVVNVASDAPPDFSPLTKLDAKMRRILERRWIECTKCVDVKAHLAAVVMMGGLLEALLVTRVDQMTDKKPLFASKAIPIDPKTNKAVPIQDWMLKTYLEVGADMSWITPLAKKIAVSLGEYRNYVHPAKELKDDVTIIDHDSKMLWDVTKNLVTQLLVS
jgi:hypothetical protein